MNLCVQTTTIIVLRAYSLILFYLLFSMDVMSLIQSSTELTGYFLARCAVGSFSIESYSCSDAVILKINRSEFFPLSMPSLIADSVCLFIAIYGHPSW